MNAEPPTGSGTFALDDGGRVDFDRLRRERRERVLAEMERRELDVLLLGREANARFTAGARRLWTAGTRPFAPGCVVVRATGQVHLLSVWDDGIPPEIPRDHLYGISWDPMHLLESLGAISGLAGARRVGVDAMSPLMSQLLPAVSGAAEIVDGGEAMQAARAVKSADEIACIRTAVAMAEGALAQTLGALQPGVSERELQGEYDRHLTAYGVTAPALEGIGVVAPREPAAAGAPPVRVVPGDRCLADGDLVVCHAGALYAGYEGDVARTYPVGAPTREMRAVARRAHDALAAVVAACGPGSSGAALLDAYERTGGTRLPFPVAHGLGIGVEPPLIGTGLASDHDVVLTPGTVLAVGSYAWEAGVGGVRLVDTVVVTDTGPESLARASLAPFGAGG
jgi:Xaa-Pro dipeptidase